VPYNVQVIYEFADTPTEVHFEQVNKDDYWEERFETFERYRSSKMVYKAMSNMEREIIAERVKICIEAMHDNVEGWLPFAFRMKDGDCINVTFKIMKTKIESDMTDRQRVTSFKLNQAAKDMQQMILELDDETEEKETDSH
jgi:hypothetical protein